MGKITSIAVFGSAGRLGGALRHLAPSNSHIDFDFYTRDDVDFQNLPELARLCATAGWEAVIIAGSITNVDACELDPPTAWTVNAHAPQVIAQSVALTTRVVFVSTDFVFSGEKLIPYTELDEPVPLSVYGKTKYEAEQSVLAAAPHNLVVRTSWLFGGLKPSLPDIMIDRACRQKNIEVVADRWSCPTSVSDLAVAILRLIEEPESAGVFHFCNQGVCTPFDYSAWAIQCARNHGMPICVESLLPVSTAESGALKAPRPTYSAMSTARYVSLIGAPPRDWQVALNDHVAQFATGYSIPAVAA